MRDKSFLKPKVSDRVSKVKRTICLIVLLLLILLGFFVLIHKATRDTWHYDKNYYNDVIYRV